MSVLRVYFLACDGCDLRFGAGDHVTLYRLEVLALKQGWYIEHGRMHLCPECRFDPDITGAS